jgi:hypothetical protein
MPSIPTSWAKGDHRVLRSQGPPIASTGNFLILSRFRELLNDYAENH